ncbi:nuclear transport factor 2 family protein [Kribbella kalugense]|uniref:SnoaL-like protein n=1 Tax=Kribbella kalugense TaxID=2512221 RepID=A0A4R8A123_9ACTN|nr:nuclear transport factor 2 family protein [Kribbella kalugense]TDW24193.1 SnoaL-like protein [Kribbella kalugense]
MTVVPEGTPAYVADRLAIQELVFSYNRALDKADEELFDSLWAPDAGWHFPDQSDGPGRLDGKAAILGAFRTFVTARRSTHHLTTNLLVTVDGDRASGRSKSYTSGRLRPSLASYDDRYVRIDGRWRFARRTITPHLH